MSWELAIILSLGSTLASLWLSRFVLLRLPVDYFVGVAPRATSGNRLAWVGRNVAALVLVLLGIMMSVPGVPGQGLLTIAVGLLISDLPGKRKLERRFLGHPRALTLINKVRERAEVAPLEPPDDIPTSSRAR